MVRLYRDAGAQSGVARARCRHGGQSLLGRSLRQPLDVGVEGRQIVVVVMQHHLERRHPGGINGDRGHLGIVDALGEPAVIAGKAAPPGLECSIVGGELRQAGGLGLAFCVIRQRPGVERGKVLTRLRHQLQEALPVPLRLGPLLHERRPAVMRNPALDAFLLHRRGEGLVECAVALGIGLLVGELMEQQPCELRLLPADEGAQHRVIHPAQRGIRGYPADIHIVPRLAELLGLGIRIRLMEIAAIDHAAGDRKAPLHGIHRQGRCSEHVPDHEGTVECCVTAITAVVGQTEVGDREAAQRLLALQPFAQLGLRGRIRDDFRDRPARLHEIEVPTDRLPVIARGGAAGQGQGQEGRSRDGTSDPRERSGLDASTAGRGEPPPWSRAHSQ